MRGVVEKIPDFILLLVIFLAGMTSGGMLAHQAEKSALGAAHQAAGAVALECVDQLAVARLEEQVQCTEAREVMRTLTAFTRQQCFGAHDG